MSRSFNRDFFQEVAEGLHPEYSLMEKFGEAPLITTATDPSDVWDGQSIAGAEIYTFSTTANINQISSSNNGDTQDIVVVGLDSNWEEVTQTVTLTGQTPATLSTSLIRVYRMYNNGTTDIAGDVYLTTSGATLSAGVPTVATTIRAMIRDGNNQTLMCVYTVPAGKTGYFWGGYVSVSRGVASATFADFTWRARLFGKVFAVKSRISCMSAGQSAWDYAYKAPVALPEKTDILIRCDAVGANIGASGGFTVLLKDN